MSDKPPSVDLTIRELQASTKDDDLESIIDSDGDDQTPTLKKQFVAYARIKNEKSPGNYIVLSQSDFWMKKAKVIAGRKLTTTDTGVCFFKFKKHKLSYPEYLEFLQVLADYKNIPVEEIIEKLVNCGSPREY